MITNPSIIKNVYKTKNKHVEEYLILNCSIPLLGFDKKYFYFANTEKLRKHLRKMPIPLKILEIVSK